MKIGNATQAIRKISNPDQKTQDSQIVALQSKVEKVRRQMQNLVLDKNLTKKDKDEKQKVLQHKIDVLSQKIVVRQDQIMKNERQTLVSESAFSPSKSYQEILDEKLEALQKKA